MEAPPFAHVGIVGLGLIGGSVALAARRRWPRLRITACDPAPVTNEAVTQGLITGVVPTPGDLRSCDLVLVATPVQAVPGVIRHLAGASGLVTDTGSTKRAVMAASEATPELRFVGGHPVAGSERSGLAAARADLFDARPWLLVSRGPTAAGEADDVREAMLASFVVGLGAKPEWTDAVTHDRVMAHVSHAPQVVTAALKVASGVAAEHDEVASSAEGRVGMLHLAASSSDVWQGILETNADFIADALAAIAGKLPTSSDALMNAPAVRDVFERAKTFKTQQR